MNLLHYKKSPKPSYSLFKQFYRSFSGEDLDKVGDIYDDEAIYRNPLTQLRGISNIHLHRNNFCRKLSECRLEYLDECVGEDSAYLKWNMHFKYKNNSNTHTLRGVTQLLISEKVIYHEDLYDVSAMHNNRFRLLGNLTHAVMKKLASNTSRREEI